MRQEIWANAEKHQIELNEQRKKAASDLKELKSQLVEEIEDAVQEQIAAQYVNDVLNRGLESLLHQTYDNLKTVKKAHDTL